MPADAQTVLFAAETEKRRQIAKARRTVKISQNRLFEAGTKNCKESTAERLRMMTTMTCLTRSDVRLIPKMKRNSAAPVRRNSSGRPHPVGRLAKQKEKTERKRKNEQGIRKTRASSAPEEETPSDEIEPKESVFITTLRMTAQELPDTSPGLAQSINAAGSHAGILS